MPEMVVKQTTNGLACEFKEKDIKVETKCSSKI